jgi:hypothetical protein
MPLHGVIRVIGLLPKHPNLVIRLYHGHSCSRHQAACGTWHVSMQQQQQLQSALPRARRGVTSHHQPSPARTWVALQLLDLAGHAAAVCDCVDDRALQPRRLLEAKALLLSCHCPHYVRLEADNNPVAAKLLQQQAFGQRQAAGSHWKAAGGRQAAVRACSRGRRLRWCGRPVSGA